MTDENSARWTMDQGARRGGLLLMTLVLAGCQSPSPPLGVRPGGPIQPSGVVNGNLIETRSDVQTWFEGALPARLTAYTVLFEAGDVHVSPTVAMPSGVLVVLNLAVFPLDGECLWGEVEGRRTAQLRVTDEASARDGIYEPSIETSVEIMREADRTVFVLAVPSRAAPDLVEREFEVEVRIPPIACFES
ncbi:MAG: hypothetical protein AB8I08_20755 [Sandaracinaceae bacterium]